MLEQVLYRSPPLFYYDLLDKDDELFVCALYTRRGGIDISPVRWSKNCTINEVDNLLDLSKYARCGIKQ